MDSHHDTHHTAGPATPRKDRRAQDFQAAAGRVLQHLLTTLGLDVWAVGRRQADDWVVLTTTDPSLQGRSFPWADTLCSRVGVGAAEWATSDVDQVPCLVEAREALGLPIHAFVTVPLSGDGGQLLGTLCGAAFSPQDRDLTSWEPQLRALSDVLGALLSAELRLAREARQREVAESEAQTDQLTGLGNRRRWDERLAAEETRCLAYGGTAAVITVDVDGLKGVNDRWGHEAGDALLRQVGEVLRDASRPGDVVARLGGDEFAVLLAESGRPEAEVVAARLSDALEQRQVSASMGVAVRGREGLAAAWREADAAMYADKRGRRRDEPVRPPVTAASPGDPARDTVIAELLSLLRDHVGGDIAYVSRHEGPMFYLRGVQSGGDDRVQAGEAVPYDTTYCRLVSLGELDSCVPDTSVVPVVQQLAATAGLPVGAYLSSPVVLPDGREYGTVCCLSYVPNPRFDARAQAFIASVADSLARVLVIEERERAGRRRTLRDIDAVLAEGRLAMAYQPICDLRTGEQTGVEALARFPQSGRTTAQWFADAARVERSSELELFTARTALAEWASWPGDLWLNLSASVLLSPAAAALLDQHDCSRLVIEVSEHEEVGDYAAVRRVLDPWRRHGLRLAVDDAGAGFSSLRHVLELSPDVIKLDLSLVHGLAADPSRRALVSSLVVFATEAGAQVVAEGVETAAEAELLASAGVAFGQGYHLGRPLPAPLHGRRVRLPVVPKARRAVEPLRA